LPTTTEDKASSADSSLPVAETSLTPENPEEKDPQPAANPQPADNSSLTPENSESGGKSSKSLKPIGSKLGAATLTRADFEQIQNGMTEREVLAILGSPSGSTSKRGTVNGHPFNTKTMMWKRTNPNIKITVTLRDDKVTGKNCIQINPKKN
jgi:hypothetical protein